MLDGEDPTDISLDEGNITLDTGTGEEHQINESLRPFSNGEKETVRSFSDFEPDFSGSEKQGKDGLERIIETGFVAYERMPMLENVLDRFVRFWTSTLRGFTNQSVEVSQEGMHSMRFGDYMNSTPKKSVYAIFKAEEWKNLGLIVIDSDLAYAIADVLIGGQSGSEKSVSEDRQPTALERTLLDKLVTFVLADLEEAFAPIGKITLSFERIELSAHFATITRPLNTVIAAQFRNEINGRSGVITVLLPYATLEPVRSKLTQQFMGEDFGSDTVWEEHLITQILDTNVTLSAVFEETMIPLSKVLSLKKGSVISLPHKKEDPYHVRLECDRKPMFYATLGKLKDMQAVRIDHRLIPPADEIKTVSDFGALGKQFIPQ